MTARTWCPVLRIEPESAVSFHLKSDLDLLSQDHDSSAKRNASVAANNSVSATQVAQGLSTSLAGHLQRFDAAAVASNVNCSFWPHHSGVTVPLPDHWLLRDDALVCLHNGAISRVPLVADQLAIFSGALDGFLSLLARRTAERREETAADVVTRLVTLPSPDRVTILGELLESLLHSKAVVEELNGLVVCGATSASENGHFDRLLSGARKLEALAFINCSLENCVSALVNAVKNSEVRSLNLERSDIGANSSDGDRESLIACLCETLKVNKFLTSLNLSYTNLDTDFVVALMESLAESDTKMLPEELGPDPEDNAEWSLEARCDRQLIFGVEMDEDAMSRAGSGPDESEDGSDIDDDDEADPWNEAGGNEEEEDEEEDEEDEEAEEEEDEDAGYEGGSIRSSPKKVESTARAKKRQKRQEKLERQALFKQIRRQLRTLQRSETQQRQSAIKSYFEDLISVAVPNGVAIANRRAVERQQRKEAYCSRRSGWSHLQRIALRGNQVGDRGCLQLALVLRDEVALSEDEVTKRREDAEVARTSFAENLGLSRRIIVVEEKEAWRTLMRRAQLEKPVSAGVLDTSVSAELSDPDEEDEYAKEAPRVLLTNVEREPSNAEREDDAMSNGEETDFSEPNADEQKEWQEWVEQSLPHIPVAPVKKGMNSIRTIDLGSCGIGRKGLQGLAKVLMTNKVLETLCLRHNPIGSMKPSKKVKPQDEGTTIAVELAELAEMLSVNRTLKHLDVSYCSLSGGDVRALAEALHKNVALVTLCVEGNQLSIDEAYQSKAHSHSYMYELWMAAARPGSALRHLNMDHNDIAECLWQDEAAALASLCCQLTSLSLVHTGLRRRHLQAWSECLSLHSASSQPTIQVLNLARNEFAHDTDGAMIGTLLRHFTSLEDLSLAEHPHLGSGGMAAALEYLPQTMRRLNCKGTGLTSPFVGSAQTPVLPLAVVRQLTSVVLGDIQVSSMEPLREWLSYLQCAPAHRLQFLSLWARGMVEKEADVALQVLEFAKACPSLLYVDAGFVPQFHGCTLASNCYVELEKILFPRRMRSLAHQGGQSPSADAAAT